MIQLELDLEQALAQHHDQKTYDTALTVQWIEQELREKRNALYGQWGRFVTRPATTRDASLVVQDLAEASEADLHGMTPWQFIKLVQDLGSRYTTTITENNHPIAVMGFAPGSEYTDMWFLGSTRYFDGSTAIIHASRRMIRHFRDKCFDTPIRCLTHSHHPQVERWYCVLGFTRHVSPVAGAKLFIL